MAIKVLAFGEVLWDIIEGSYHIGGAPFNFAGHMAKLGAESYIVSSLGHDDLGDRASALLENQNINTSLVDRNSSPTGTVQVRLDNGIPSYEIVQGSAWDSIEINEETKKKMTELKWDVLYIGSLAQRSQKSRMSARWILENVERSHVFFDVNLRQEWFSREIIEETLKHTTILKVNDEEVPVIARLLFGQDMTEEYLARKIMETYRTVSIIIVTMGGEGALFFDERREYKLKPEPADVVDTVGAGDSFSGAFVYSYLNTGDIDRAGRLALDVAAFVVSSEGALPDYSEELKKKISLHLK
ncbi:carbohydrate kinase family protein [Spirochaeta isovalerica]|uniref:Fructokinase n=1 Tax=Spirochaeta isovalerica TaxID=150 RepID=A0A841RJK7_9SPIO|nr:carbohydrate kinase [Spirochaeta isovalerica]MBB6482678.1 fructokinase [Spirochaeta isovalerica]